jgi:hypothetical protein
MCGADIWIFPFLKGRSAYACSLVKNPKQDVVVTAERKQCKMTKQLLTYLLLQQSPLCLSHGKRPEWGRPAGHRFQPIFGTDLHWSYQRLTKPFFYNSSENYSIVLKGNFVSSEIRCFDDGSGIKPRENVIFVSPADRSADLR